MIEGINPQTILPKEVIQIGNQTVIPTPVQGDVDMFKTVLQQAEISKSGDLKIGSANPSETSILQKLNALDNSYRIQLDQKQQVSNLLSAATNKDADNFKIRTLDNSIGSDNFKIRTTADFPGTDSNSSPANLLANMKESMQANLERMRAINDKIVNIQTWSANHSVFMAVLKQTSDGFKTLFRSSG
jgi:hypothetical protein